MIKKIKLILFHIIILLGSYPSFSQDLEMHNNCKIVSIDTTSVFPDYYIIKAATNKGKIIIFSYNEKSTESQDTSMIKINGHYDFELLELDSIPVTRSGSIIYWHFKGFRGGNGKYVEIITDREKDVDLFAMNYPAASSGVS
jgi:hypothetical protein